MDPLFVILALPLVIHLVGCYYVDHHANGIDMEKANAD